MHLEHIIAGLHEAGAFPNGEPIDRVVQTHASVVFLLSGEVYKIKKPVDLGFLDYSTLEKRLTLCRAEVELNRRLAPDVYLGVVPITEDPAGLRVGGRGPVVEWAVKMRRLPDEATARSYLQAGRLLEEQVVDIARRVARFHGAARRGPDIDAFASFDMVSLNCRDNFSQLPKGVVDEQLVTRLAARTESELTRQAERIAKRAATSVACETHGDLRLEHIYVFPEFEKPRDLAIIDCIEFSEQYRFADPVSDVAFTVMELQVEGAWSLARAFVQAYVAASGDDGAEELLGLYVSYRAMVRAKVEAIRALESEVPKEEREAAGERSRVMARLAAEELASPDERSGLVLVGGLPGTGKSVLSRRLVEAGVVRSEDCLRADIVRKTLAGIEPAQPGGEIYSQAWSDRTHAELLEQAAHRLAAGRRVIVDSTLMARARRTPFVDLARGVGVRVLMLHCEASPEVIRPRLAARAGTGDPSDADWVVYERLRARAQFPESTEMMVEAVDASKSPQDMQSQARRALVEIGLVEP